MKAMCQAVWLLTVASGNFIVLIIAESSAFTNQVCVILALLCTCQVFDIACFQALEFFFFAILIGAVTILFAIMAFFYKYVTLSDKKDDSQKTDDIDESAALITEDENTKTYDETGTEGKKYGLDDAEYPESQSEF